MDSLVNLRATPAAKEIYMIAGWRQWADAGSISSGLPAYLIDHLRAHHIGDLQPPGCYLFQLPGTHHFLRPEITFEDGYRTDLQKPQNQLYYSGTEERGLVIFLGDEPHLNVETYAEAFFAAVRALNVDRVVTIGGVYGAIPYHRERHVSAIYTPRSLKEELEKYAVDFSDYSGGATIGSYLIDRAEQEGKEFTGFYTFVPAYDFGNPTDSSPGVRIENDFKAWYELMRRFNHMFNLSIDLSELEQRSRAVIETLDEKMEQLEEEMPQLDVQTYLAKLDAAFEEQSFMPLDDMWERELDDLFGDLGE